MTALEKPPIEHHVPFSVGSWQVGVRVIPPPFAAVIAGHFAGNYSLCGFAYVASLVAFFALAMGAWNALRLGLWLELVCAVYAESIIMSEMSNEVLIAHDENTVIGPILLLLPVLFGLVVGLRNKSWLLATGAWMVLFAATTALTFNLRYFHCAMDFWSMYLARIIHHIETKRPSVAS